MFVGQVNQNQELAYHFVDKVDEFMRLPLHEQRRIVRAGYKRPKIDVKLFINMAKQKGIK
jgi:hypothetical protein